MLNSFYLLVSNKTGTIPCKRGEKKFPENACKGSPKNRSFALILTSCVKKFQNFFLPKNRFLLVLSCKKSAFLGNCLCYYLTQEVFTFLNQAKNYGFIFNLGKHFQRNLCSTPIRGGVCISGP